MNADADPKEAPAPRRCGECSLCCVVLRVDELAKLGGTPCPELGPPGSGCSIHASRPGICRRYRCLWLRGWFEDDDRPDRLGALLDYDPAGGHPRLAIREARAGVFEESARLKEIAERMREQMPVRVTDSDDVLDPDRPFRVLLAGGEEQRVTGDVVTVYRDGQQAEERRLPWLERQARRLRIRFLQRKLRRMQGRAVGAALLLLSVSCSGAGPAPDGASAPSGREQVRAALAESRWAGRSNLVQGTLSTLFSSLPFLLGDREADEADAEILHFDLSDGTVVGGLFVPLPEARDEPAPLLMASFGFLQDRWGGESKKAQEKYGPAGLARGHMLILDHPTSGPFLANNGVLSVGSYDDARIWIEVAQAMKQSFAITSIHLLGVSMSGQTVVHALIEDARLGLGLFASGLALSIAPDFRTAPGGQLALLPTAGDRENPWRERLEADELDGGVMAAFQKQGFETLIAKQFLPSYQRVAGGGPYELPIEQVALRFNASYERRLRDLRRSAPRDWNRDFSRADLDGYMETTRSARVIDRVRTPLVLLSARDDPAVRIASFREVAEAAADNPWVLAYEARQGGHFGFDVAYGREYVMRVFELLMRPDVLTNWNERGS